MNDEKPLEFKGRTMGDAYNRGRAAFCQGKPATDNPYNFNEDADSHIEWKDGWDDAQEDDANGQ
jgi:ribosome modulation factor